jgi:membrane-bound ClpP family serine protease
MDWYLSLAAVLIGCGVVMLAAEFFLPTGGVLVVVGVVGFIIAVSVIVLYGTFTEAIVAVLGLSIGLPIAWSGLVYAWKSMALSSGLDSESLASTFASVPEVAELELYRGRFGRTLTPMRPAGSVEIDGRRVDAMSEGMMIDAGMPIKCVDVKPGKVIVRQVESESEKFPDLKLDFEEPT